ncbi:MAG: LytTR family DNA-binding domain-containing protein [Paracoccaceae bacterium]|nr:LytTR family DNA-binding domain-containing protein [Paracoccaceae bacterium]MDG2258825.1 LytTR family DNA-binding domain-containing protein [Paracoccaceae bacterium]
MGPFGTFYSYPLADRVIFWALAIIAGTACIGTSVVLTLRFFEDTLKARFISAAIGTALGSAPATFIIMIISDQMDDVSVPLNTFSSLWASVVLIGLLISCVHVVTDYVFNLGAFGKASKRPPNAIQTVASEQVKLENVPLLKLLPNGTRPCQIMSFSMQDHYVEIVTMNGSTLHLMRFNDVMDKLGDLRGERVHRSHWVSLRHLIDIKKDGRRHLAILTGDQTVPISSSYLDKAQNLLNEKNAAQ